MHAAKECIDEGESAVHVHFGMSASDSVEEEFKKNLFLMRS